jgi:hypothetical protein
MYGAVGDDRYDEPLTEYVRLLADRRSSASFTLSRIDARWSMTRSFTLRSRAHGSSSRGAIALEAPRCVPPSKQAAVQPLMVVSPADRNGVADPRASASTAACRGKYGNPADGGPLRRP